jgi:spore coat polysaccharide biosynthesis predicted glycosyltransferase SpsG
MNPAPMSPVRPIFRLAAGARLGFGHLVRGRALARALEVPRPSVSLRGSAGAKEAAARLGMDLVDGRATDVLERERPNVLVIDDPSQRAALVWRRAAQALRVPVVSVHDLGLAYCGADLTIDGSVVPPGTRRKGLLTGPAYAILDPSLPEHRGQLRDPNSILIALGGGPRLNVALTLADALRAARPELRVRIAGGLVAGEQTARRGILVLGPQDGLASELARCAVAITGAGVSLYEAACLDAPAVVWPVVRGQFRTAQAFHRQRLATAIMPGPQRLARAVRAVLALLADGRPARTSGAIDGLGAARVAAAVRALIQQRSEEAA